MCRVPTATASNFPSRPSLKRQLSTDEATVPTNSLCLGSQETLRDWQQEEVLLLSGLGVLEKVEAFVADPETVDWFNERIEVKEDPEVMKPEISLSTEELLSSCKEESTMPVTITLDDLSWQTNDLVGRVQPQSPESLLSTPQAMNDQECVKADNPCIVKRRERNRLAAERYRHKGRNLIKTLQARVDELVNENNSLTVEMTKMAEELRLYRENDQRFMMSFFV